MILAIMFSISMSGPQHPPVNETCGLLKAILKDRLSIRVFQLNSHPELSVRFLDRNGVLDSTCTFEPIFGKKVEIVHKPAGEFPIRTLDIMIPSLDVNGTGYKVNYYQPSTGAVGYIVLTKKNTGFKITKVIHTQY